MNCLMPSLIGLDDPAHLGADLVVSSLADLGVPHDALAEVVRETEPGPKTSAMVPLARR